jgi:hypothetical protein
VTSEFLKEILSRQCQPITPEGVTAEFFLSGIGGCLGNHRWSGRDSEQRIANRIGRITPAGLVTEFVVPTAISERIENGWPRWKHLVYRGLELRKTRLSDSDGDLELDG